MRSLGCNDRIQHNAEISAGRIFHSGRHIHTADSKTVLLIFHRTGSYGYIREKVGEIPVIFRIKHLVGAGKSAFLDSADMHFPDRHKAGQHIGFLFRVRLVDHTFISLPGSTGFICVNPRNDQNFIGNFFLDIPEPEKIVAHGVLIICGAWSDDGKEFIRFSRKNIPDFLIPRFLQSLNGRVDGILVADLFRCRQFLNK